MTWPNGFLENVHGHLFVEDDEMLDLLPKRILSSDVKAKINELVCALLKIYIIDEFVPILAIFLQVSNSLCGIFLVLGACCGKDVYAR